MIIIEEEENKWDKERITSLIFLSVLYYAFYLFYMLVLSGIFHPFGWITIVISVPNLYLLL
ncbi:MAG: hypothetical protein ACYDAP_13650, partial [Thermoplasmataceae archaeon]